jgi:elongation factor P--(R)-beta-lysine ligase
VTLRRSASLATLQLRARMLAGVRGYFAARGVLEVETPALSAAGTPDPAIDSVEARVHALGERTCYLHTSPEYAMKRLLAAGAGDIYQVCRVFRDGELGRWHQPEFTMLEWYRTGWDEQQLIDEVEDLVRTLLGELGLGLVTRRATYRETFLAALGIDPLAADGGVPEALRSRGIDVPPGLGLDALLDLALATLIVPQFPRTALTFVYDYPPSQAALAQVKPHTPPVAARFEAFLGGIELANGFRELTDGGEQQRRFAAELEARRRRGRATPPIDADFLAALAAGLPACAGVALGFDRLVAFAVGLDNVADAISFAHDP